MLRRLVVIAAACAAMLGASTIFSAPATADVVHVHTVEADLLRVCVIHAASNTGLCVHV